MAYLCWALDEKEKMNSSDNSSGQQKNRNIIKSCDTRKIQRTSMPLANQKST